MLVSSINDIQKVLPFVTAGDFDTISPAIESAEEDLLPQILDADTIDDLNTANEDLDAADDKMKTLHKKVLAAIIPMGLLSILPHLLTKLSSGGLSSAGSIDQQPVKMWEYKNVENNLLKNGYKAIDNLYAFLEQEKDYFTDWAASEKYSVFKKYFINTTSEFNNLVSISDSRQVFLKMVPNMESVEELMIKPMLGETFFNVLKAKILAGNPDANEKVVIATIKKIVALHTVAMSVNELNFNIGGNGVSSYPRMYNDTYTQDATSDLALNKFIADKTSLAEKFSALLLATLKEKASLIVFPTYYAFINTKDETTNYNDSATGIFRL